MRYSAQATFRKLDILWLVAFFLVSCRAREITHTTTSTPTIELRPSATSETTIIPTIENRSSETHTLTSTVTPNPTRLATKTLTLTPLLEATSTSQPSSTPTPPFISIYHSLRPGQYVIRMTGVLEVVSFDGKYQNEFVTGIDSVTLAVTKDGRYLALTKHDGLYIYDLLSNSISKIPGLDCYQPYWSPDGTRIIVSDCQGENSSDSYIITLADNNKIHLPSDFGFSGAVWSPNGEWIAYGRYGTYERGSDWAEIHPGDGIYWTKADCLLSEASCNEKTYGPAVPSAILGSMDFSLSWSPDSRYLAVLNSTIRSVYLIDIRDGSERTLVEDGDLGTLFGIAWSPDGEWLAVGRISDKGKGTYLFSPWRGESEWLVQDSDYATGIVISWINIPWSFAAGDIYTITPAGHDLNLHASPTLNADVLRKLQPGDTVTILEGPVDADGYTWWKMKTNDGLEGWAVEVSVWYEPVSTATPTPTPSP